MVGVIGYRFNRQMVDRVSGMCGGTMKNKLCIGPIATGWKTQGKETVVASSDCVMVQKAENSRSISRQDQPINQPTNQPTPMNPVFLPFVHFECAEFFCGTRE
mmetsp:Transcript_18367/g.51209  ORF Transcript_18367/g.51209 Transcript_18367/m.51209 type:complete len:103 (-) Transcript_18367:96-404(-)